MPLPEGQAHIQFLSSREMPMQVYEARLKTGAVSNTVYLRRVVAEALHRDLGIPMEVLNAQMPPEYGQQERRQDGKYGPVIKNKSANGA